MGGRLRFGGNDCDSVCVRGEACSDRSRSSLFTTSEYDLARGTGANTAPAGEDKSALACVFKSAETLRCWAWKTPVGVVVPSVGLTTAWPLARNLHSISCADGKPAENGVVGADGGCTFPVLFSRKLANFSGCGRFLYCRWLYVKLLVGVCPGLA